MADGPYGPCWSHAHRHTIANAAHSHPTEIEMAASHEAAMNTEYLRGFVMIAECGSLAEASRRLGLNPATLTARVQALEAELDIALLQRCGRVLRPTPAGIRVLDDARAILRNIRDLHATAHDASLPGELHLGVFASALTTFLPPVMERAYARHPKLRTFVKVAPSIDLCRRVAYGELDAALAIEPHFRLAKNCRWSPLLSDHFLVLAPYSLRGHDAHALLRSQPFIRYDRSSPTGQMVDRYLRAHDIHPNDRIELDSASAIAAVVARGLGVAVVPAWSARRLTDHSLIRLPLPGQSQARPIGLVWDSGGPRMALIDLLLQEARLALQELNG